MRGEHFRRVDVCVAPLGSSPHARGTPRERPITRVHRGIIPACAGNTAQRESELGRDWDHPRMRGEHFGVSHFSAVNMGSSPHARGTHCPPYAHKRRDGIIPACAGNTSTGIRAPESTRDHPRMRGEHITLSLVVSPVPGSSPHARGTRPLSCWRCCHVGIIPACAGNTT